ncbi:MAG: signal peptidase I [Clostridia bacterium]|nr:signal peptidase I [Clostridia bacterium]
MNKRFDIDFIREKQRQLWVYDDMPMLIIVFIAIYFFVSYIVPSYLLTPVNILGSSMEPTLFEGDKVILYMQGDIDYGNIVVLYAPDVYNNDTRSYGEDIIKRVMGLPGDTVCFKKEEGSYVFCRTTVVNGMTVETVLRDEFYIAKKNNSLTESQLDAIYKIGTTYNLKENEYFVLGDNRLLSLDSRNENVGIVKREQIIGKALFLAREGKTYIFDNDVFVK